MTINERKKAGYRAFKVRNTINFLNGTKVKRSDYFETNDKTTIALLLKAKRGQVVELELGDYAMPRVVAKAPGVKSTTAAAPPPDVAPEEPGEKAPNWRFMTIPKLRAWIDMAVLPSGARVDMPGSNTRKPQLEAYAQQAWSAGARPHTFYGLPGGPEPSPGMAGPAATTEVLNAAIKAANEAGEVVPIESMQALAQLKAAPAEDAEKLANEAEATEKESAASEKTEEKAPAEAPKAEETEPEPAPTE